MTNLENADDISLIKNIQQFECNKSLEVLISRHTGICFEVAKRFLSHSHTPSTVKDEIINHKDLVIYESAKTFTEEKEVKFGTWVGHNMRYFCLDQINEEKKHHENRMETIWHEGEDEEKTDLISQQPSPEPTCDESFATAESKKEKKMVILDELSRFDDVTKKIIITRYFSNSKRPIPYRVIAPQVGLSIQGVINREKKFFKLTKNKKSVELIKNNN